jgi:hypothetical protein
MVKFYQPRRLRLAQSEAILPIPSLVAFSKFSIAIATALLHILANVVRLLSFHNLILLIITNLLPLVHSIFHIFMLYLAPYLRRK